MNKAVVHNLGIPRGVPLSDRAEGFRTQPNLVQVLPSGTVAGCGAVHQRSCKAHFQHYHLHMVFMYESASTLSFLYPHSTQSWQADGVTDALQRQWKKKLCYDTASNVLVAWPADSCTTAMPVVVQGGGHVSVLHSHDHQQCACPAKLPTCTTSIGSL